MSRRADTCVQIFARAPRAGRVKTRLIPALGAEGALRLHLQLLERTLALGRASGLAVELWLDGPCAEHTGAWRRDYGCVVYRQRGADLGARLHHASSLALARRRRVLLLGADCVTLSVGDLRRAAAALERCDAVLAPAHDGGYALLGLACPAAALFRRMPWGTRHVCALTRRRVRRLGWRLHQLAWQHDIDRPRDLVRLAGVVETSRGLPTHR